MAPEFLLHHWQGHLWNDVQTQFLDIQALPLSVMTNITRILPTQYVSNCITIMQIYRKKYLSKILRFKIPNSRKKMSILSLFFLNYKRFSIKEGGFFTSPSKVTTSEFLLEILLQSYK